MFGKLFLNYVQTVIQSFWLLLKCMTRENKQIRRTLGEPAANKTQFIDHTQRVKLGSPQKSSRVSLKDRIEIYVIKHLKINQLSRISFTILLRKEYMRQHSLPIQLWNRGYSGCGGGEGLRTTSKVVLPRHSTSVHPMFISSINFQGRGKNVFINYRTQLLIVLGW